MTESLVNKVRQHCGKNNSQMLAGDLHITIRHRQQPGPDDPYDEAFHKLPPQKVTLNYMYFTEDTAFCTVVLTKEAKTLLGCSQTPHVSLQKPQKKKWKDLNYEARMVQRNDESDWTQEGDVQTSLHSPYKRVSLHWVARTTPQTHLTDGTET